MLISSLSRFPFHARQVYFSGFWRGPRTGGDVPSRTSVWCPKPSKTTKHDSGAFKGPNLGRRDLQNLLFLHNVSCEGPNNDETYTMSRTSRRKCLKSLGFPQVDRPPRQGGTYPPECLLGTQTGQKRPKCDLGAIRRPKTCIFAECLVQVAASGSRMT